MKTMFRNCPELLGLMLGLGDAVFRAIAAFAFDPGSMAPKAAGRGTSPG